MKKPIKKKWMKELRSGKYKQGMAYLKDGDNFCCLGVLCDIHRKETKGKWIDNGIANEKSYLNSYAVLPSAVISWAGLGNSNPSVAGFGLAHYNDGIRANFNEIADLIEKGL